MKCNIKSLYICVKDMARGITFEDSEGNHIEVTAPI